VNPSLLNTYIQLVSFHVVHCSFPFLILLQDKEAAWRDDIRAKAAAIQAMQQQAKKRKK